MKTKNKKYIKYGIIIIVIFVAGIIINSQIPYILNQYKVGATKDVWVLEIDTESTILDTDCLVTLNDGKDKSVVLNQCLNSKDAYKLIKTQETGLTGIYHTNFCENKFIGYSVAYTLVDKKDGSICYGFFEKSI